MHRHRLAIAVAATLTATQALAAPFAPFDVRVTAMGGAGVASAQAASASLFNPALLSAQPEGDSFQFLLGAGALLSDESEMFDEVDKLQDSIDAFDAAVGATNQPLIAAEAANILKSLDAVNREILSGDAAAALGVGVPGPDLGVGVFVAANAYLLGSPTVAATDRQFVQDIVDDYADNGTLNNPVTTFPSASTVTGIAVSVTEYGVALSRRLELANGILAVGITPKAVSVSTFEYTATVDNFDEGDIEDYETTDSGFDLDTGLVYSASAESPWQFGLVARNLLGSDYKTGPNIGAPRKVELATQLRAGAAHRTEHTTVSVDLDLLENDGIAGDTATQFLALGAEYGFQYVQLRGGYRANLAGGTVPDVLTAGLGLGPVDLGVVTSDGTTGGYLQLSFGW